MKVIKSDAQVDNFAAAQSYWDPRVKGRVQVVQPGDFASTDDQNLSLTTLLGSCVSACICDPHVGIGGLNHFLLPIGHDAQEGSLFAASRYGVQAMEMLINSLLKLGAERSRLEAKIFGGANVISLSGKQSVGDRNQAFALSFLRAEKIEVTAQGLGGTNARRVFFQPGINRVLVQTARASEGAVVRRAEAKLRHKKQAQRDTGNVEFFRDFG